MSLSAEIERAKESLMQTFELALQYGTEDIKNPNIYLDMAEELISIKGEEKRSNEALEVAKNESNLDLFDETYQRELEQRNKRSNIKKTSEYKSFANSLQSKISSYEEELFTLEVEVNANDPITRKRMQNPVKNIICGHHYEQTVILKMIEDYSDYRCPVAGCANNQFITKEHLKIDNEFRQQILATAKDE